MSNLFSKITAKDSESITGDYHKLGISCKANKLKNPKKKKSKLPHELSFFK